LNVHVDKEHSKNLLKLCVLANVHMCVSVCLYICMGVRKMSVYVCVLEWEGCS